MALAHRLALAALVAVTAAACTTAPPTPETPDGSPALASPALASPASAAPEPTASPAWLEAGVAQPSAVTSAPSLEPGYQCHPCHFLAENDLFGIGETPTGLIAVGIEQPPAHAVAFASTDGTRWVTVPDFPATPGSAAVAVAFDDTRTVVVGHDPTGATAWASNGGAWTQAPRQADLLVPYAAGAMTSVTSLGGVFVAGGYRDDPLHVAASAAVWRSVDGLTWKVDDAPATFAGGRILGVAAQAGAVVAVGTSGDPNYGPAAAWRWTEADGWQQARIGPETSGAMRAVTATTSGFLAVGLNGKDDGGRAWTSRDGSTWTAVPDQPALHYFSQPVRMQAVVAGPHGIVAGGWRSDAGKGSAVTWTSADGVTWQGPAWEPSFSGGQISGLAMTAGGPIAVGRTGYPDWNQAAIWVGSSP